jgi:hypothetical protein
VLDNLSTHTTPEVKAWLEKNPNVQFHFTPVGSSWINQIETWFGIITRQAIRHDPVQLAVRVDHGGEAEAPMARCERHGWFRTSPRPTCSNCPCPLPANWTGRPSTYCSPACRQAAYRHRKNAAKSQPGVRQRRTVGQG